ncbi:hypothetical protein J6TS7_27360 [Paenibacillus dendritiformis]|nr:MULTISPECIES: hypothetical protein [Paenibacillus]MEB9892228.1 hypothetical protein [Bacillus cereus]GIO79126.1 hypothetical protein J6TS7_27360 [Paenibacillus dendritiformis]
MDENISDLTFDAENKNLYVSEAFFSIIVRVQKKRKEKLKALTDP